MVRFAPFVGVKLKGRALSPVRPPKLRDEPQAQTVDDFPDLRRVNSLLGRLVPRCPKATRTAILWTIGSSRNYSLCYLSAVHTTNFIDQTECCSVT